MNQLKNKNAITLIALVVTIVIIFILAGVTLSLLLGENNLIRRAQEGSLSYEQQMAKEKLEIELASLFADKELNPNYNENEYLTSELQKKDFKVFNDVVVVDGWKFIIDRSVPKIINELGQQTPPNQSLIGLVSDIDTTGHSSVQFNIPKEDNTMETVSYNIHSITHNGNLVLDGINSVNGATLSENTYEFGDNTTDVATATENAKNMVVLKVNGNLTINSGVTLTACKSDSGYGGPKGMMIYCTGTITNHGTISMTARGAKAEGENVYLWQNSDGSYEYVPAVGASGGKSISVSTSNSTSKRSNGANGDNGTNRGTGGGGSGAINAWRYSSGVTRTYAGASGTSYSGGSGSGSITAHVDRTNTLYGGKPVENGGAGGRGIAYQENPESGYYAFGAGGAGNPGGLSYYTKTMSMSRYPNYDAENGTGGLLIINTDKLYNTGTIESNGSKGGGKGSPSTWSLTSGGGGSGAGSINISYSSHFENSGSIKTDGGAGGLGASYAHGGAGGNGSISIGKIVDDTYVADSQNAES